MGNRCSKERKNTHLLTMKYSLAPKIATKMILIFTLSLLWTQIH